VQNALQRLEFPEIFLGLVSPVGAELKSTIDATEKFFRQNGYDVVKIKVTDYFMQLKQDLAIDVELDKSSSDRRIDTYIDFGNKVREIFQDNSILASYSIYRIMKAREKDFLRKKEISYQKRVYIIHQFKTKEEIDILRLVYGSLFFQVSVYSNKDSRIAYLAHKIAHDKNTADQSEAKPIANRLVARDENEKTNKFGQKLTKIFHDADVIINCDIPSKNAVEEQVFRFFELVFSSNEISPTKREYGMFAAKAAALRTLDLSRQV
jgi:hypothetical protein